MIKIEIGKTKCITCMHMGVCKYEETMKEYAKTLGDVEAPEFATVTVGCDKYMRNSTPVVGTVR